MSHFYLGDNENKFFITRVTRRKFNLSLLSLANGCCIPVTYKDVYAGNINLINGDWYGLLVKNTNNPADNINIKLSADGTITEGNSAQ